MILGSTNLWGLWGQEWVDDVNKFPVLRFWRGGNYNFRHRKCLFACNREPAIKCVRLWGNNIINTSMALNVN